jgi:hypothetical protein
VLKRENHISLKVCTSFKDIFKSNATPGISITLQSPEYKFQNNKEKIKLLKTAG